MTTVLSVFIIAVWLFAGLSAGFLAILKRRASTSYLAAAVLTLLLHTTFLELGIYDATSYTGSGLTQMLVEAFSSVVLMVRFALSVSSAVFLALTVFSLSMDLKSPQRVKREDKYYYWSDNTGYR